MFNKGNFDKIRADIDQYSVAFFSNNPSQFTVDENWLQLKSHLHTSINSNIPSKLSTSSKARPPWLNSKVHNLIRRRDRLAKIASKSGSSTDRGRYLKARNDCSKLIDSTHSDYLTKLIGNVKSDPRAFYRYINSKKSDASTIPAFKSDGDIITSALGKVECLNKYFASVFTTENNLIPPLSANHPSMDNIQVTTPGVFKLLSNLDMKKSSGPDDISPTF